jgi:hypothetical protein
MSDWKIREGKPDHHKHQNAGKLCTFGKRTDDEAASNGGKDTLKRHENQFRNDNTLAKGGCHRFGRELFQEQAVKFTYKGVTFCKG